MKVSTILILGAAGAGAYLLLTRKAGGLSASDRAGMATQATLQVSNDHRAGRLFIPLPASMGTGSGQGTQSAPSAGGPSGRDVASGLAAAGAGAGCAAIPGIGAVASPLCGAIGAQAGAKAYEYGSRAIDTITGWF